MGRQQQEEKGFHEYMFSLRIKTTLYKKAFLLHCFTLSRCTEFFVTRKAGGSGALAKKSAMGQLTVDNNFVLKHNS